MFNDSQLVSTSMPKDSAAIQRIIHHLDYCKDSKKPCPQFKRWHDRGRVTEAIWATKGHQYCTGIRGNSITKEPPDKVQHNYLTTTECKLSNIIYTRKW